MTKLLRDLLRSDYLAIVKAKMMEKHHNNTSVAKRTGYSGAQIGNLLKDRGSDDCLAAVCKVLGIDIRRELFKMLEPQDDSRKTGTDG